MESPETRDAHLWQVREDIWCGKNNSDRGFIIITTVLYNNDSPVHEEGHGLAGRHRLVVGDGACVRVLVVALDHSLMHMAKKG